MPQTTMSANPPPGKPGLGTEDSDFKQDISTIVEEATGIAPGLFVVRGTNDRGAKLVVSGTPPDSTTLLGVSLFSQKARQDFAVTNVEDYEQYDTMPVRRKGRIWMTIESAFTAGAQVYCRYASGSGGTQLGAARSDGDTSTAAAVTGASFVTSGNAGDLGVVELDLS